MAPRSRTKESLTEQVWCICYFTRCRRHEGSKGRLVSRSTRDRHRKEDMRRRTARAWPGASDGRPPPPLFLDALQNNFGQPVRRSALLSTASSSSTSTSCVQGQPQSSGSGNVTADGIVGQRAISSPALGSCDDVPDSLEGVDAPDAGLNLAGEGLGGSAVEGESADTDSHRRRDCMDWDSDDMGGTDGNDGCDARQVRVVLAPRRTVLGDGVVVDDDDDDEEAVWAERYHEGVPDPVEEQHVEPYYLEDDDGDDTGHIDVAADAAEAGRQEQERQQETGATNEASSQERQDNYQDALLAALYRKMDGLLASLLLGSPEHSAPMPVRPPAPFADVEQLRIAIKHYAAWLDSKGTVKAYSLHKAVLEEVLDDLSERAERVDVPSLYKIAQAITSISALRPQVCSMCPAGCVAFTGPYADLAVCPGFGGKACGLSRFKRDGKTPAKSFEYVPVLPRLQAYFSAPDWAEALAYRGTRTAAALRRFSNEGSGHTGSAYVYGDMVDGWTNAEMAREGQFSEQRDCVVAISTDGAQLIDNKRASSIHVVLLQLINLPPELRFKVDHQHVSIVVPGPNNVKDLESFLWPLYVELADLSERGAWTWDAALDEWFSLRVHLGAVFADQPASAKVSKFVGGAGRFGCRLCRIECVRKSDTGKGAYFPLKTFPVYDSNGRGAYDPLRLPLRTVGTYAADVGALDASPGTITARMITAAAAAGSAAPSPAVLKATASTLTGLAALPVVASSRLFRPESFFALDPFHLFNANLPQLIYKTLVSPLPGEFGLDVTQRSQLGAFMATNRFLYPSWFSSRAPRDVAVYSNSQFKMVEWAALLHHFLPPFLHSIGAPPTVCAMLDDLCEAINIVMDRAGVKDTDIAKIRCLFASFVELWENAYVSCEAAISRATISVHLLLHVADQVVVTGSVKVSSQAACERHIGYLKRSLRSFRSPYQAVANRALADARLLLSKLHLGMMPCPVRAPPKPFVGIPLPSYRQRLSMSLRREEERLLRQAELVPAEDRLRFAHYGRYTLGDLAVRAVRAELVDGRRSAEVEALVDGNLRLFQVIHFTVISTASRKFYFAFARPFLVAEQRRSFTVGTWAPTHELIPLGAIKQVVAGLVLNQRVYVVRRGSWNTNSGETEDEERDLDDAGDTPSDGEV